MTLCVAFRRRSSAATVAAALLCVAAAALAAAGIAAARPVTVRPSSVQLSPSINMIGKFDWQVDPASPPGAPWSRCLDMVWRAVGAGSDRLNFVPTHHWLAAPDGANAVGSYCYMQHADAGGSEAAAAAGARAGRNRCFPWSDAVVGQFRQGMALCFAEALRQGMTLYVRPHLDDGSAQGAWRNGLLMRPTAKYGGFSYEDIMLAPLADALRDALATTAAEGTLRALPGRARPVVYFAMQGEMSATVMRFASEWGGLVEGLRRRIGAGGHADVQLGIGLNFNRLDDVTSVSKTYDSSRISWLMWQLGAEGGGGADAPLVDVAGLRRLLQQQLDFVGISAYAPYTGPGLGLNEFENSAFMFGDEMRHKYGIDVLGLVNSGRLELQYSEFGLGGGGSYGGQQVATSPSQVALRPFFGLYGDFNPATNPWALPSNAAFLREFYAKALSWLSDPAATTYRVSAVFVWSMASWDVLGVYPESTTGQGSYRDPVVADAVASYNKAVVAAQRRSGGEPARGGGGGGGGGDAQPIAAGK